MPKTQKAPTAARPRKATRLSRGVYVYQAAGPTAYLGSIIEVIDSQNRATPLTTHCKPEEVEEVAAGLWNLLDQLDPISR